MKSYTEMKGRKPFNWFKVLSAKLRLKNRVPDIRLSNRSKLWTTCACGQQCAIIPRDSDGEPRDKRLSLLGYRFHLHIVSAEWGDAMKVLRGIEVRAIQILKTMKAKKRHA